MWPQKSLAPIVIIVRQTVYLMLSVIWVRQEYFWLYLGKTFHFMIRDVEVAKKYFHSQRINHSKATCTKSQLTNVFLFSTIGVTVLMRSNFYFFAYRISVNSFRGNLFFFESLKWRKFKYRISSYSCRGNYSFLNS